MATIRAFTTIEQSRKLVEILPLESADMCCFQNQNGDINYYGFPFLQGNKDCNPIPCWSLAALRNLLPVAIKVNENTYLFESHNTFDKCWVYRYYNEVDVSYLYCKDTSEIDACVSMIEKLNELNLL